MSTRNTCKTQPPAVHSEDKLGKNNSGCCPSQYPSSVVVSLHLTIKRYLIAAHINHICSCCCAWAKVLLQLLWHNSNNIRYTEAYIISYLMRSFATQKLLFAAADRANTLNSDTTLLLTQRILYFATADTTLFGFLYRRYFATVDTIYSTQQLIQRIRWY